MTEETTQARMTLKVLEELRDLARQFKIMPLLLTKEEAMAKGVTEDEWVGLELLDKPGVQRPEKREFYELAP
jgi:hypothetical protein